MSQGYGIVLFICIMYQSQQVHNNNIRLGKRAFFYETQKLDLLNL